jgi:hypothetical protein
MPRDGSVETSAPVDSAQPHRTRSAPGGRQGPEYNPDERDRVAAPPLVCLALGRVAMNSRTLRGTLSSAGLRPHIEPSRWRHRTTMGAISSNGMAKMSCSTKATRSAGASDSSTTSSARPPVLAPLVCWPCSCAPLLAMPATQVGRSDVGIRCFRTSWNAR